MSSKKNKPSLRDDKPSTSWNLYVNNIQDYVHVQQVFSKEECEKIIKIAETKRLLKATTKSKEDDTYRKSQICWLYSSDDMEWAFRKVTDIILDLNNKFFQFDIFGLNEGFQFTNYKSPDGTYRSHVDTIFGHVVRKLSLTIQLTDPKEYEGGELYIYNDENGTVMEKQQGSLTMFPSYTLHKVTTVTKGERNSLVCWVTGKQFK